MIDDGNMATGSELYRTARYANDGRYKQIGRVIGHKLSLLFLFFFSYFISRRIRYIFEGVFIFIFLEKKKNHNIIPAPRPYPFIFKLRENERRERLDFHIGVHDKVIQLGFGPSAKTFLKCRKTMLIFECNDNYIFSSSKSR